MTVSLSPDDVREIVEIASIVGDDRRDPAVRRWSLYLLVRPKRGATARSARRRTGSRSRRCWR